MTTSVGLPKPEELRVACAGWLADNAGSLPQPPGEGSTFAARLAAVQKLQAVLYDAGWLRYGWPPTLGGLGGSVVHRAVVYDELANAGFPDRSAFEHVEILLPPLVTWWASPDLGDVAPRFLRGDEVWCQGFSEPDAGSDLGALTTRARREGDAYRITGRKIWTSWATWADRCLLLARTGTRQDRHRGLTAFMVDLRSRGVTVSTVRQANGEDELAEVLFDDVVVPASGRVGNEGDGWEIALDILEWERGPSAWLRQALLVGRAEELVAVAQPPPAELGDVILDLHALRSAAAGSVLDMAGGIPVGPRAALVKMLRTEGEQHLYELADRALGGMLALGSRAPATVAAWQAEFLFSRAVSIYGGTSQMQLNTIAKYVLDVEGTRGAAGPSPHRREDLAEMVAVATSVLDGAEPGADALVRLGWAPGDVRDPDVRLATAAIFRAQGRALAVTPALGAVAATAAVGDAPGGSHAWMAATALADDQDIAVVGPPCLDGASSILVDLPGQGIFIARSFEVLDPAVPPLDPSVSHGMVQRHGLHCVLDEGESAHARGRVMAATGFAIAHEILGTCDAVVDMAVEHARSRIQFGSPIASMQAVQHLCAQAEVQRHGILRACDVANRRAWLSEGEAEREAVRCKALAGRNGRRIMQLVLQILGAIGFTDDYPYHRYLRRLLALDALFASAASLREALGAEALRSGRLWRTNWLE